MEEHDSVHCYYDTGVAYTVDTADGYVSHLFPHTESGNFNFPAYSYVSSPQSQQSLATHPQWPSQIKIFPESAIPPVSRYSYILPLPEPVPTLVPTSTSERVPNDNERLQIPLPESVPTPAPTTISRRVLTDNDRWEICEYRKKYPKFKQLEIGGKAIYPLFEILLLTRYTSGIWGRKKVRLLNHLRYST